MLKTTLNNILSHNPCGQGTKGKTGFSKLLSHIGKTEPDDEPLALSVVLDSNGFLDALWCVRTIDSDDKKYSARLALSFAEDARHVMTCRRSGDALDVARRYLAGAATKKELEKARRATSAADAAATAAGRAVTAAAASAADAAYAAAAAAAAAVAAVAAAIEQSFDTIAAVDEAITILREKQIARLRNFFYTGEIVQ